MALQAGGIAGCKIRPVLPCELHDARDFANRVPADLLEAGADGPRWTRSSSGTGATAAAASDRRPAAEARPAGPAQGLAGPAALPPHLAGCVPRLGRPGRR